MTQTVLVDMNTGVEELEFASSRFFLRDSFPLSRSLSLSRFLSRFLSVSHHHSLSVCFSLSQFRSLSPSPLPLSLSLCPSLLTVRSPSGRVERRQRCCRSAMAESAVCVLNQSSFDS